MSKKTFGIITAILGILMIIGGIACIGNPIGSFSMLSGLLGLFIIVIGVAQIVIRPRRFDARSIFNIVSSVIAVILGMVMIINAIGQFLPPIVLTAMIIGWLVIDGFDSIYEAIALKSINNLVPAEERSPVWLLYAATGIIKILFAFLAFSAPALAMIYAGIMMGITLFFGGIQTIILAYVIKNTTIEIKTYEV